MELIDVLQEHLESYVRLAFVHRGKSEADDDRAAIYQDKADALFDVLDDWKRRNKAERKEE